MKASKGQVCLGAIMKIMRLFVLTEEEEDRINANKLKMYVEQHLRKVPLNLLAEKKRVSAEDKRDGEKD